MEPHPLIHTQDDWWEVCEGSWDHLLELLYRFGDPHAPVLTLPFLSDEHKVGQGVRSAEQHMEKAKRDRNAEVLCRYFNAIWGAAPDNPRLRLHSGWYELCDLCSEEWVFDEEPA